MTDESTFEVTDCAIIGRTYEEYLAMFGLEPAELEGRRVLDCPSGVASFVATATDRGVDAVGADVVYRWSPDDLADRCREDRESVAEQLAEKTHLFEWSYYDSPTDRRRYLERASERFLEDYPDGREAGRYVPAALPSLPFAEGSFSLVLSAHFLFLYDDRFDYEFHLEAIRELARVATDEVRVYPLQGLDAEPSDHLEGSITTLETEGYEPAIESVPFEFQSGSTEMLVLRL
ncbi:class I SAM-dependent methyltransferase [Natrarchaeobius sp. A-rgal3]|uniref:class I SAM-dependent methyltransferase n=1 Tax=Natrarchaeobius versutus TaxID=1679078 RepID=UPI00350FEC37